MSEIKMLDVEVSFPDILDVDVDFGQTLTKVVAPEHYMGPFEFHVSDEDQVIPVKDKTPAEDICVKGITGEQTITENGTYNTLADKAVTVDVNPDLRPLSVSENGQYSPDGFDGYSQVMVDVPQRFTLQTIADRSALKNLGEITISVPTVAQSTFGGWTFEIIHLPDAISINDSFRDTRLKYIDMPNVKTLYRTFYGQKSFLGTYGDGDGVVKLKKATNIESYVFYECLNICTVYFYKKAVIYSAAFRTSGVRDIYVPWSEGEVAGAPWEANNATIHYDTVYDEDGNVVSST